MRDVVTKTSHHTELFLKLQGGDCSNKIISGLEISRVDEIYAVCGVFMLMGMVASVFTALRSVTPL